VNAQPSLLDDLLDELLPDDLEWRGLVSRYPKSALTLAALGGFYLGRKHGRELVEAVSELAANTVSESVNGVFGRKVI